MKRWLVQILRRGEEVWITIQGRNLEEALAAIGEPETLRILELPDIV